MSSYTLKFNLKDNDELLELANNPENLNEEAKYSLYKVLESRKDVSSNDFSNLRKSVNIYFENIESLFYLKNIGFSHNNDQNGLIVKRSTKAKAWDIVGTTLGLFLMFLLGPALSDLKTLINEGFNNILFLEVLVNISLGILGFLLFYKGFNRLLEFSRFKIVKSDSGLIIFKQGVTNVESVLTESNLYFEWDEDKAVIGINLEDKIPLISSKENSLFMATLESLYKKLSK